MSALFDSLGTRGSFALPMPGISMLVWGGVLFSTACSAAPPTTPTTAAPVALLTVTIDTNATAAIPSLSVVKFDASGSSGTGLSFQIDLGDGTVVHGPRAEHVYAQANKLNGVVLTVTDSIGRVSIAHREVFVANITRGWISAAYNPTLGRQVSVWLLLQSQQGAALAGTFSDDAGMNVSVSGQLLPDRGITLVLGNGDGELVGRQPEGFNANAQVLTMTGKGGWVDGQTLEFHWPVNSVAGR
jgi:hypothetical protein